MEKYCTAGQDTDDNITRRMRIACWITVATATHDMSYSPLPPSRPLPKQQRLHERTSKLSYTYIALLRLSVKYLHPLETSSKYLKPCYTVQSSTFLPHTRHCLFLRFAQQPTNIALHVQYNMNRLIFTMEPTAFSVR